MMVIERGAILVLVCENGKADDLVATLTEDVKRNIVEIHNRKIEVVIPQNMNLNEAVANAFIGNGAYKVSKLINVENMLYAFYVPDEYRSQLHKDNQRLAENVFGKPNH
ncbi:hypothetical protein AVA65_07980 [Salmonella enterica subsp. enterica serovar Minnesota]|nr:hypothetical protein [Salmonella enterica subsp. enterica serovar Minnesota]